METPITNKDYENIEVPYDSYLERSEQDDDNGSVMNQPVKSEGDIGDVWIRNFIRSENWKPKSVGFYINGLTGYAEFMNVFISGNIEALTGTIGGFTIGATTLSATSGGNTTILSSGATAFSAGPTGSPTTTITQAGGFSTTNGVFTGTITGSTITGGVLQTASSGARIVISASTNDLRTYNSSNELTNILTSTQLGFWYGGSPVASIYADVDGLQINGGCSLTLDSGGLFPYSNFTDLGNATFPWYDGYFDGTIIVDTVDANILLSTTLTAGGTFTYRSYSQPVALCGYVNSGASAGTPFPSGWGVSSGGTGLYTVSHGLGTTNYVVTCTARASTVKNITVSARNPNDFQIRIANLADVLENNDFMFTMMLT